MKYPKKQAVSQEGVAFINKIISNSGCIFRPIHNETDIGLDAYVEFVNNEEPTAKIFAVQIKSGKSFKNNNDYIIPSDKRHFDYWDRSVIPVIGIVYDPEKEKAFWVNITEFLNETSDLIDTGPYIIHVSSSQEFNSVSIVKIQKEYQNNLKLSKPYELAELLFSDNVGDRWQGFFGITGGKSTLDSKLTCSLLIKLTTESDISLRANVYDVISRYVAHPEVSFFFLSNRIQKYMESEIKKFGYSNVLGMIECVDEEGFERGTFGQ